MLAAATCSTGSVRTRFWRRCPTPSTFPPIPGRHSSLRAAIAVLGEELGSERPGANAVVIAVIDALLPLIVRAWMESHSECVVGDWPEALTDPGVSGALERIHAEPERAWTVAELAREVGLSRAAFARRFTRAVGE